MLTIGFDIGSSSIKASLLDVEQQICVGQAQYPDTEMPIHAPRQGWAEQDPDSWWQALKIATARLLQALPPTAPSIGAIGISYQMHGLVAVDADHQPVRPSIIWCDSRAVETGDRAGEAIGPGFCLNRLLNTPGNFTASKLAWVKQNEPAVFEKIHRIMLPGDYIAMRMSGEINTTITGLSEGTLWDFEAKQVAGFLLDHWGISGNLIPPVVDNFNIQGQLSGPAANELGLPVGIPITYRAGDQPNNALSLNVLKNGEVAATAGTSGVVYGVTGNKQYDFLSRVNTFAHVNYTPTNPVFGVLLCVNGTGILNSWTKQLLHQYSYPELNAMAASVQAGSGGISVLPFGNGAERMLDNKNLGAQIAGIDLNRHGPANIARAVQEGIAFSFHYGLHAMRDAGINPLVMRAGNANMFLSPVFRHTLADITGIPIELYNSDGAMGAAVGAAIGAGYYASANEAFGFLKKIEHIIPNPSKLDALSEAYDNWKQLLVRALRGEEFEGVE